jgi:hypothetical protein
MYVVGEQRNTFTDFWYLPDTILGGQLAAMGAGWPVNESSHYVDLSDGGLISVTINLWARTGDPDVRIGYYAGGVFVDETFNWTALAPYREGDFYSRTWWRECTEAMNSYQNVDYAILQSSLNLTYPGIDGGEGYVVGWQGVTSLHNEYGIASSGTVHTPDTTDPLVANFYVGGGGIADPSGGGGPRCPFVTGTTFLGFSQQLGDSDAGPPTFTEEQFGVSMYAPHDGQPVGHWETGESQDALLVGISGTIEGSAQIEDPISGVVHLDALS